jgi:hypothetical protein
MALSKVIEFIIPLTVISDPGVDHYEWRLCAGSFVIDLGAINLYITGF